MHSFYNLYYANIKVFIPPENVLLYFSLEKLRRKHKEFLVYLDFRTFWHIKQYQKGKKGKFPNQCKLIKSPFCNLKYSS